MIVLDRAGTVRQYNKAEQELSKRSASEVIGRNFFTDIAPCTQVKEFGGRFREYLQDQRTAEFFFLFPFKHGIAHVYVIFLRRNEEETFVVVKQV